MGRSGSARPVLLARLCGVLQVRIAEHGDDPPDHHRGLPPGGFADLTAPMPPSPHP